MSDAELQRLVDEVQHVVAGVDVDPKLPSADVARSAYDVQVAERPVVASSASPAEKADADFDYVRDNLMTLVEAGSSALQELLNTINRTGHPRAFDCMPALLSAITQANKDILDLHKKVKDVKANPASAAGSPVTNNAVFVGTTAELAEILKQHSAAKPAVKTTDVQDERF